MKNLSRFIVNNRLWIVIVFAVLLIASIVGMMFVEVNYNDSGYLPDDSSVAKGLDAMYGEFGEGGNATVMLSETTIEKAVEFKEWMESIDGVATVIWIDDIFLSEEIWVIKKAQESTDGVTRGKAVYFIMHMVNKLGSLNDSEMSAIEGVLGGGSLDMNALSGVLAKLNDGLSKSDQSLFLKFMLGMQSAVNDPNNPLQAMGGGFDIGMLDSFKPSLEMFYHDPKVNGQLSNEQLMPHIRRYTDELTRKYRRS